MDCLGHHFRVDDENLQDGESGDHYGGKQRDFKAVTLKSGVVGLDGVEEPQHQYSEQIDAGYDLDYLERAAKQVGKHPLTTEQCRQHRQVVENYSGRSHNKSGQSGAVPGNTGRKLFLHRSISLIFMQK